MKRNSKLSLALHALGHLATAPRRPLTSEEIARHSGTNAVVVRRVLGLLREADLVASEKGHAGGWRLSQPADRITLADVYQALGDRFVRKEIAGEDNPPDCVIEACVHAHVEDALAAAEHLLVEKLREKTIEELAAALRERPDQ